MPKNLGDLMISMEKVAEQAEYLGHSQDRELGFLTVHGFLHLNGYDHMKAEDEKEMFQFTRRDFGWLWTSKINSRQVGKIENFRTH